MNNRDILDVNYFKIVEHTDMITTAKKKKVTTQITAWQLQVGYIEVVLDSQ